MKTLNFYKMEGTGNDFVVVNNLDGASGFTLDELIEVTPKLCDRRFGIGADGLMVLESSSEPDLDFTMIYRNADGSDAGMCGNGSRCLSLLATLLGMNKELDFNVHKARYHSETDPDSGNVAVHFPDVNSPNELLINGTELIQIYSGTEHVVLFKAKETLENEDELIKEGRSIRLNPALNPPGTNVNFVHINSGTDIDLQTYERGVENLTLACGTGAIASAMAAHSRSVKTEGNFTYTVHVKGGELSVSFTYNSETKTYSDVILAGPAHIAFTGSIEV